MKYVNVFVLFLLLFSVGMSVTKTVNFEDSDGDPYFCNPCFVNYANASHSLTGQTALGSSAFTFSGSASDYTIIVNARLLGFNASDVGFLDSGDNSIDIAIDQVSGQGKLAYVTDSDSTQYYPQNFNRNGIAYSSAYLQNVSKAFGYESVNQYNAYADYTLSSTVPSDAFNSYDTVAIVGIGTLSGSMANAITNAHNNGVKIVIASQTLYSSGLPFSGIVSTSNTGNYVSPTVYSGMAFDGSSIYPDGEYLLSDQYVDTTYSSGVGRTYFYFPISGDESNIRDAINVTASGIKAHQNFPMVNKYYNYYIAPSWNFGLTAYEYSDTLKALMYLSLLDFNMTADSLNTLTLNVYEGTENCGNVEPIQSVLCCISNECGVSSAVTSSVIQYSSLVAPIDNPEISARGDATEPIVFWGSEYDFYAPSGVQNIPAWERYVEDMTEAYVSSGVAQKKWLLYQDKTFKRSRITFAGTRKSTDGQDHWLLNYDFYDTYLDTALLDDVEFSLETLNSGNSGAIDYSYNFGLNQFRSCQAGDYWNMSVYYGINTSHFGEVGVNCINGALNRISTSALTTIPDFDIPNIDWNYGFAPNFADFQTEIGYNDTTPMKKVQSNRQGGTYNWIRHMVVAKFTPQLQGGGGDTTDTGGFIVLENNTLYYKYTKYDGGNITLNGQGNEVLTCTAPSGYSFYNPLTDTYSSIYERNISINTDISLGVQLQKTRPLRMIIHVTSDLVEDIDNARCSIQGFTDSYSTNGYCYFNNVQPNTIYNVTVRTSGAESKVVETTKFIADYYDTFDADNNGIFCGNFDGNYTFEVNVDHETMSFFPYVVTQDDSTPVTNAVVEINGKSCRTGTGGYCNINVEILQGAEYEINVTKSPQIIPYSEGVYMSQMDCDKNYVCSYFLYVEKNASYGGGINDDAVFGDYLGFTGDLDLDSAITIVMDMMSKPMFLGLLIICCITVVLGYWLGSIGVIVGLTTGVLLTLTVGLIPISFAFGYFITLALIVAVFMRLGFVEIGGNMGGGNQ